MLLSKQISFNSIMMPLSVELNVALRSKPTLINADLLHIRLHASQSIGLVVGELVHGLFTQVKARSSVVDGQDVDCLAVVGHGVALAALGGVPAFDVAGAANERESGDGPLGLVAVPGGEVLKRCSWCWRGVI